LWPAGEPGRVGGEGPPGTVHVTSDPPGALVWRLVGIGPSDARIELPYCDADVEVLVVAGATQRKPIKIPAAKFLAQDSDPSASGAGTRTARVSAK
jgi:hypothetical protein